MKMSEIILKWIRLFSYFMAFVDSKNSETIILLSEGRKVGACGWFSGWHCLTQCSTCSRSAPLVNGPSKHSSAVKLRPVQSVPASSSILVSSLRSRVGDSNQPLITLLEGRKWGGNTVEEQNGFWQRLFPWRAYQFCKVNNYAASGG